MIKVTRYLLYLLVTFTTLYSCDRNTDKSNLDKTFKVGVIADQTGFMSGHGQSIEMGTKLAAESINKSGGILGMPIELIVLDGQSDPTVTGARARELIQQYKVSLLLGTGTSAATLAAIGPATESKIPFIYALDGEIKTCSVGNDKDKKLNPYVFASGFSERMAVKPLLEFLASKIDKPKAKVKIYFIGGDYVYPRTTNSYAIKIAQELGMKVVGEQYSDTSTSDYSPIIRKIQQSKPDILIVTNPGASGVTFMRQAKQFSLGKKVLISGFATFDQEAIKAMGDQSEGIYVINRYSKNIKNKSNEAFLTSFSSTYPEENLLPGPTAAAGAYGALLVAAEAAISSKSTTAEGILKGLPKLTVDLPQGSIYISENNHMFEQHLYLMQIINQTYQIISITPQLQHPEFEGCSVL